MRKTFKLDELDCANCGATMDAALKKTDGVVDANITSMTQTLVVEADDARFDEIMDEAQSICRKIEPDCEIVR